ncbi:hypothetical protein [Psychroserpens sp.]|uniref:hypothetical protein n=1 Tax=Psychroserpens sp. TaxID=2020870 RepID=UPI001B06937B|nr:hypothetical protein [Psychroserpens sp.]MBO6606903.1 hypothetical protein [Psychroserpens sp.]MBO6632427.1 hypothetical protein [Psychroserpens sp.]MBO6654049.1 hypothetical protein [Psychroserpens sp.]MBO6682665.1 hypothetical protein [Psychroserpens sp.]MBO6750675.1 hypothetical protein [Psychroserpens sp.]
MKKITLLITLFMTSLFVNAQTDGINYQAVIIDNNPQEIPGVDIPSNNLPNKPLEVQFTIFEDGNTIVYQETHLTETDPFGMINLMIGQGSITGSSPALFEQIYWDNPKQLRVEIDLFDGNGLVVFSNQNLTYIPYVRHREIIATSTLDVDGETNLNNSLSVNNESPTYLSGALTVDGETNLGNALNVNNQSTTTFTGDLFVLGTAFFTDGVFDNLTVNLHSNLNTVTADGETNINNEFNVNNNSSTFLSGPLNVEGDSNLYNSLNVYDANPTALTGNLTVDGISNFNNRIRLNVNLDQDDEDDYEAYPLQVAGSSQGIAVKLNANDPNRTNNYISFWSNNNIARGRIEGNNELESISRDLVLDLLVPPGFDDLIPVGDDEPIPSAFANDYFNNDYAFGAYHYTIDFVFSIGRFGINLTAASGACLAGDCDDAIWSFIDMSIDGIQLAEYILYNQMSIGVAFESGSADYAEWLVKENADEVLTFGDVVGVKGGSISKEFRTAENYMVVSQNPLISGAMPQKSEEHLYERIAFMGQVPVKVIGKVNKGDYILPSGAGDGLAIAIPAKSMKVNDYKNIVGVAWESSPGDQLFAYVNTAVGINSNDMVGQIEQMQSLMNQMQRSISKLDASFEPVYFDLDENSELPSRNDATVIDLREELNHGQEANKEKLQRLINETNKRFKNHEFDFSRFPYLEETLNNPTKENGEKLANYYMNLYHRLKQIEIKR